MKQCRRCLGYKLPQDFRKDKNQADGFEHYCRVCAREMHRLYDKKRDVKTTRKQSIKRAILKREYKITLEQYQQKLIEQDFRCKICKTTESADGRAFSVDHDHKTNHVRGLLCNNCNSGLGFFRDSPSFLREAIYYLEVTCHLD